MASPRVSVIVPTLNAESTIDEQLAALIGQTYVGNYEVVVADNGSTDGTHDRVEEAARDSNLIRWVQCDARRGANFARNCGADQSSGDLLMFCDADDVVAHDWIERLVTALVDSDIAGGRLEYDKLNPSLARFWKEETDLGSPKFGFLPFVSCGNCAIWRSVFVELGGYREDYVGGSEEIAFSWTAQMRGVRMSFAPEAIIHYRFRRSPIAIIKQHFLYGRHHPRLFREFKPAGMPRSRLRDAMLAWVWVTVTLPLLPLSPSLRQLWLRRVGLRLGHLVGSLLERTFYV